MGDVLTQLDLGNVPLFKHGKVREVFDLGSELLLVATDRISAFDCILPDGIPDKGKVLTQLSAWWFGRTSGTVPNHMISCDPAGYPDALKPHTAALAGRSMLVRKTEALPVECVARGYIIGSGWKEYSEQGAVSGIELREGYKKAEKLDEPIFTPAHKAESGHDENITFDDVVNRLGTDTANSLREITLQLYSEAAEFALTKGIIIADTKFEFGMDDGKLVLIDEALTPDSSRFWPAETYQVGISPPSFDKQFVRDYLETLEWDKTPPAPALPDDVIKRTQAKYIEAFEKLTGQNLG